jgi:hypothetical protein
VSGTWAGQWTASSGIAGTWQTDWIEDRSGHVDGSAFVTGTSCGTRAGVAGERQGCSISFGLVEFGGCSVDFEGTIDGNTVSGTFIVTAGVSDQGQWSGSKQ